MWKYSLCVLYELIMYKDFRKYTIYIFEEDGFKVKYMI